MIEFLGKKPILGITKFNFIGKKIVVTGGTRGIGEGIVTAFLQAGAEVFFLGLNIIAVSIFLCFLINSFNFDTPVIYHN